MRSFKWTLSLIIVAAFASCSKDSTVADIPASEKTMTNVSYGTDPLQKMDIYLPAGRRTDSTKVMVIIHGGSWYSGDKNDIAWVVDSMKKRLPDYAFFNINYRLSTGFTNTFPTQEIDVRSAVNFIFTKTNEYEVSQKFILAGASAGAHLAMLQGFKDSVPVRAKAIVSFFGPSDLTDMYNNPVGGNTAISTLMATVIGKTPVQDPTLYFNSSPVNFIRTTSAPTILLHGGVDLLVSPSQSVAVQNSLTAKGVANQYVFYPAGGHADWDAATYTDAFNKIQAFLKVNVH